MLPAADEAESIWTNKFGFNKVTQDEVRVSSHVLFWSITNIGLSLMCSFSMLQLNKFKKHYHTVIFQGTSVLQKSVPEFAELLV